MHYTGMAALRTPAHIYYDPWLFALSVVVAVVLSTTALFTLSALPRFSDGRLALARITGSAVMGFAIVLMHYTGMFATYFYPDAGQLESGVLFDPPMMAAAIAVVSLLIVGLALSAALFDRRVEQAETFLRDAVNSISEGFVIFDSADRFVMCNDAYRRFYRASTDRLVPGQRASRTSFAMASSRAPMPTPPDRRRNGWLSSTASTRTPNARSSNDWAMAPGY